jgi:hypothetical protein
MSQQPHFRLLRIISVTLVIFVKYRQNNLPVGTEQTKTGRR